MATEVIAFISRKGGTGKTTNAIMTATTLSDLGHSVALVETDTNYTLSTLRKMELHKNGDNHNGVFPILGSADNRIRSDVKSLKEKGEYEYLIVDSAGKTTDEHIKGLCLLSDTVVIPSSLTPNDLLVAYQTIEDLKTAKKYNEELRLVVLPSRIHSRTKQETISRAMENLDAEILPTFVPAKNNFTQFSTLKSTEEYRPILNSLLNLN